ncbi:DUF742 domain-containing protein [Amycolatopsis sp. NPDC051045]|uniref:DUF742 domain-containing protein n=1 Tax=Amycolatopsis sp. NPDC051045 TaxID=3156922 RepID=UPI00343A9820
MKNTHNRRAAKIGTAALSFGGWGDYEVWAAHGFTPKPKSDPTHPQVKAAEGGDPGGGAGGSAAGGAGGGAGGSAAGGAAGRGKGTRKAKAGQAADRTGGEAAHATRPGKADPTPRAATRRGETAGPARTGQGAAVPGPDRINLAEPTSGTRPHEAARPRRPGEPGESVEHHRTRGRRAAGLGTRPEEPGPPVPGPPTREPLDGPEPPRPRPYVRGTAPPPPRARHVLPPEVMLFATGRHRGAGRLEPDLAALCRMCQIPTSIAEVSAYLIRSLDDTRALVQRGIDCGLLVAEVAQLGRAGRPPLALLHRVHQGLLRL